MIIEITEQQLNNLMVFLDRVEVKGLKENQALMELVYILQNPTKNEVKDGGMKLK